MRFLHAVLLLIAVTSMLVVSLQNAGASIGTPSPPVSEWSRWEADVVVCCANPPCYGGPLPRDCDRTDTLPDGTVNPCQCNRDFVCNDQLQCVLDTVKYDQFCRQQCDPNFVCGYLRVPGDRDTLSFDCKDLTNTDGDVCGEGECICTSTGQCVSDVNDECGQPCADECLKRPDPADPTRCIPYDNANPPPADVCCRTPQVRDEILNQLSSAYPDITCDQVTLAQLRTISELDLRSKGITALKPGDFAGLTNMVNLTLGNNRLVSLPDGVFDGLTNLERLDLYENSLESLPDNVFDDLTNLEKLRLYRNSLVSLPDGVFDGLTNLERLDLDQNSLVSLPDGVFDRLTNLRLLYLVHNRLVSLPDGVFDRLTNLERLYMSVNDLGSLSVGVFDKLTRLQDLGIASNGLVSLPDGVFDKLTKLRRLVISDNGIACLQPGVFENLLELENLQTSGNVFSCIPRNAFGSRTDDDLSTIILVYPNTPEIGICSTQTSPQCPGGPGGCTETCGCPNEGQVCIGGSCVPDEDGQCPTCPLCLSYLANLGDAECTLYDDANPPPSPPCPCRANSDCSPPKPYCELPDGVCVACRDRDDCPPGEVCINGECTTTGCPPCDDPLQKPACLHLNNNLDVCVQCFEDSHCQDNTRAFYDPSKPVCKTEGNLPLYVCVACVGNDNCPSGEVCNTRGNFPVDVCVKCVDDNDCGNCEACTNGICVDSSGSQACAGDNTKCGVCYAPPVCGASPECNGKRPGTSVNGGICNNLCNFVEPPGPPPTCLPPGEWLPKGDSSAFGDDCLAGSNACCCGDDPNNPREENKRERETDCIGCSHPNDWPGFTSDSSDRACCGDANDAVYAGKCHRSGTTRDDIDGTLLLAWAGKWYDCDSHNSCACRRVESGEADVGEYENTIEMECCGDDPGEHYRTTRKDTPTINAACCNDGTDCVDSDGSCVSHGELSSRASIYPDTECFCNAGAWRCLSEICTLDTDEHSRESDSMTCQP